MIGQGHYDYALFALRGAYIAHQITTADDAHEVVLLAAQHADGAPLDDCAIADLTARCHAALMREGALEKNPVGEGFIRKAA